MLFSSIRGLSRWLLLSVAVLAGTLSMGCATVQPERPAFLSEADDLSQQLYPAPVPSTEGSLWQAHGPYEDLFLSQKARRVGDIITVQIVESSSASNRATTETERSSGLEAGVSNFFGAENQYPADKSFFNPFAGVKGDMTSDFEGDGTTQRSGEFRATLTARVITVLPNGNMRILGTREIKINNETQYIYLSGLVRPEDITAGNTVLSTQVADAKLDYSGFGIIDARQRPGWLANALNRIWPF
jgi:flagellar L-ring protein precursor FlgH